MTIHEAIKSARLKKGWSMEQLAEAVASKEGAKKPLSWQTIQQWENGTTAPKRTRLKAVGDVLGLSMADLGLEAADEVPEMFDLDAHPDLVRVRKVQLRLQAGVNGFAIEADEGDGAPIFFRAEWLQLRGYKPYKLLAIKVKGNSMEPSLYPDDMVVVNTADTEPKDGKVFAVNYEGEAVIKRMVRDGGIWWLASDNPDQRRFPRKECTEGSCIIVGQVIHRQSEQI
jgi:phage repressor protein C with HTH and peptisase S24 domain